MSFLGSMKFVLKVRGHRVTDVEIKLPKEIKVEDLVRGRSPQEAFDIFQTIFALCPNSQLAAAKLALRGRDRRRSGSGADCPVPLCQSFRDHPGRDAFFRDALRGARLSEHQISVAH